jgi:hypothetical protein
LGQLAPGMETRATAISNRGVIVGVASEYVGGPPAVLTSQAWVRLPGSTQLVALPVPTGTTEAEARGINDSGLVVGDIVSGSKRHAVMWDISTGSVRDITPATTEGMAYAINSSGTVVGRVTAPDGRLEAAVWQPGSAATFLRGPTGCSSTATGSSCNDLSANDINDEGVVVGSSDLQGRAGSMFVSASHAVRWTPLAGGAGYGDIHYYPGPGEDQASSSSISIAYSINNAGAAVGSWNPITSNRWRAVRFDP